MSTPRRGSGRPERAYRRLLRLYPAPFRRRFGRDMAELFADLCREARHRRGRAGLLALWTRAGLDLLVQAAAERRGRTAAGSRPPTPHPFPRPQGGTMDAIRQDLRYAVRTLLQRPGFSFVAVLTLAIGIGANSAIFSVVRAVLLEPLPYPEPERLVKLHGTSGDAAEAGNLSVPDFADFARASRTFASLGAHGSVGAFTLTGDGEPERVSAVNVSSGFFRTLGIAPQLGRVFRPDEDRPTPPDVAVISDGLWHRRFGGDPAVLGRSILLSGTPTVVVGVMPPSFQHPEPGGNGVITAAGLPSSPDVWAPIDFDPAQSSRSGRWIRAVGRLAPGVPLAAARAEMATLAAALERRYPTEDFGQGVGLEPLLDAVVGDTRPALLLLLAAVAFVLLIACANLANLLLASATSRQREMAIRAALGARRRRVVRQLLTESLALSLAGGALGLALAFGAVRLLPALAAGSIPRAGGIGVDGAVLAFTLAVAFLTGLVFGLAPALAASRPDLRSGLKEGVQSSAGRERRRSRDLLVVAEVALSLVLLAAAGLLVQSFWRLARVDPGFAPERVLSFELALPLSRYPEGTQIPFYDRLYDRLAALPGVRSVGAVNILPLTGDYSCDGIQIDERPLPEGQNPCAEARSASPGYFRTLGIPLLAGRGFTARDREAAPRVVIVNRALARRFWPGEDPIGKRLTYSSRGQGDSREVVGVIGDVRHFGLDKEVPPAFYTPQAQPPSYHGMTLVVRAAADPEALAAAARAELRALDPQVPIYNVRTMASLVGNAVAGPRFRTLVLGFFAASAVVLAMVGIYGVLAYAVGRRRREIGIRMALGAAAGDVLRLIVGEALRPALAGLVLGLAGSLAATRLLRSLLFGVAPADPATLAAVTLLLAGAALLASWLPARRAARLDPVDSLRSE